MADRYEYLASLTSIAEVPSNPGSPSDQTVPSQENLPGDQEVPSCPQEEVENEQTLLSGLQEQLDTEQHSQLEAQEELVDVLTTSLQEIRKSEQQISSGFEENLNKDHEVSSHQAQVKSGEEQEDCDLDDLTVRLAQAEIGQKAMSDTREQSKIEQEASTREQALNEMTGSQEQTKNEQEALSQEPTESQHESLSNSRAKSREPTSLDIQKLAETFATSLTFNSSHPEDGEPNPDMGEVLEKLGDLKTNELPEVDQQEKKTKDQADVKPDTTKSQAKKRIYVDDDSNEESSGTNQVSKRPSSASQTRQSSTVVSPITSSTPQGQKFQLKASQLQVPSNSPSIPAKEKPQRLLLKPIRRSTSSSLILKKEPDILPTSSNSPSTPSTSEESSRNLFSPERTSDLAMETRESASARRSESSMSRSSPKEPLKTKQSPVSDSANKTQASPSARKSETSIKSTIPKSKKSPKSPQAIDTKHSPSARQSEAPSDPSPNSDSPRKILKPKRLSKSVSPQHASPQPKMPRIRLIYGRQTPPINRTSKTAAAMDTLPPPESHHEPSSLGCSSIPSTSTSSRKDLPPSVFPGTTPREYVVSKRSSLPISIESIVSPQRQLKRKPEDENTSEEKPSSVLPKRRSFVSIRHLNPHRKDSPVAVVMPMVRSRTVETTQETSSSTLSTEPSRQEEPTVQEVTRQNPTVQEVTRQNPTVQEVTRQNPTVQEVTRQIPTGPLMQDEMEDGTANETDQK